MADQDTDNKTEQPTGRRLSEAADRGQFAKSPELSVVFILAATLGVLAFTARATIDALFQYMNEIFTSYPSTKIDIATISVPLGQVIMIIGKGIMPVLCTCAGAAILANGLQTGFQLSGKAVSFKVEQLNPVDGFQRIFSKATLVRSGLDLLKLLAIGIALYQGARTLLEDPLFSAPVEAAYLGQFLNQATMSFLSRLLFALSIIAAISYAWERRKTTKELMMTHHEVKEEHKSTEGDPRVKGVMRRMARRLAQKQMLSAVRTADVIVTNPTHYAVALKYERGVDKAPVVLAKGENHFARRIKALAAEHSVPTIENRPVARLLYAMGKVGEPIPPELFQAVAEILAVVYRTHRYYFHQLKTRRLEGAA
jgi:flagellar biosynthetic protein FlhB